MDMFSIFRPAFTAYGLLNLSAQLQVFLARGLQLEKTSKAANVQYIEVLFLSFPPPLGGCPPNF